MSAQATTEAMFKLRRPCAKCPFRTDVSGYLRRERARQIATDLANGAIFYCHQTTECVETDDGADEMVGTPNSSFCAGALILMEKAEAPNQAMRTAERLGIYDAERMDTEVPVHASFVSFVNHHGEDTEEETECCHIADMGCEAPAGYLIDGAVVPAEEGEVHDCPGCGEPVCASCSNGEGVCSYCAEGE
jgi:hypothetical protein